MFFHMPVRLYEEEDCVRNHARELGSLGSRALIVTGRHSARANGALADVEAALDAEGVAHVLFDRVEENPSVETVMEARRFGVEEGVDFVIGIGGGSPLDAAKAIALMVCHKDKQAEFLDEYTERETALPVAAVPTTCGTGSEATAIAVLTRHEQRTKGSMAHRVFPTLSLVDVRYLTYAPAGVLRSTAVDALAHLVESAVNVKGTDYSMMFVREGLHTWSLCREVLAGEREPDREDYRRLMNASTYAGMAIAHTGTSIPHGLSYCLTYELGLAHGKACGYFLPGYLREAPRQLRQLVMDMAGFSDVEEFAAFVARVCEFPDISSDILERSVAQVASNETKLSCCPYPVDEAVLRRIAGLEAAA